MSYVFFKQILSSLGPVEEVYQAGVTGTLHLLDFCAVFVDLKRRHALDSSCLGALSIGIDVELLEDELGVVWNVAHKDGSNSLAGWAPGRSEVNNQGLASVPGSRDSGLVSRQVRNHHVRVVVCHLFEVLSEV